MSFATQNNWLLPLDGEEYDHHEYYVRNLGLAWQIDHESTPEYERLQLFFWNKEMAKLSAEELRKLAQLFSLPRPKRGKAYYILAVAEYFQNMTDRIVYSGS